MLRFGLVLLVATSAFAAPSSSSPDSVNLLLKYENEVAPVKNTGQSNHLLSGLFDLLDGGDSIVNTITLQQTQLDLASKNNKAAQALALGQAVSTMLAQATGVPGDTCIASSFINAFVSGNYRHELKKYINVISNNLGLLIRLKNNPKAARFATGPQSGCSGGGRTYKYEAAWNAIIDNSTPATAGLINEQYCVAKCLINALSVKSNNIGAVLTASSLPPAAKVFEYAFGALSKFVSAVIENRNTSAALGAAQSALAKAVQKV